MKLKTIYEGHWEISPEKYPGSILPKERKAKRHGILVYPSDRSRFMRKMGLAEDYNGEIDESELIDAPTSYFDEGWREYALPPPPSDDSSITKNELDEIISFLRKNDKKTKEAIAEQDTEDLEDFFFQILSDSDIKITNRFKQRVSSIVKQLTTIGLHFKLLFDRARPKQLLPSSKADLITGGKTAKSPSYPSSHALIGKFLADLFTDLYPKLKPKLMQLGYDLGMNRVKAGYHYRSDYDAGIKLAKYLYKVNHRSLIKSLE